MMSCCGCWCECDDDDSDMALNGWERLVVTLVELVEVVVVVMEGGSSFLNE